MSKNFILPEKWYIEGDESREDVKDAWNDLFKGGPGQSSNFAFYKPCFYHLNEYGIKRYSSEIPSGYTKITLDEFLEHVVGMKKEKSFIQDQEYNNLLIKLLSE